MRSFLLIFSCFSELKLQTEEDECTEEPGEEACSAPVQCDCLGRICFQIRSDNENKWCSSWCYCEIQWCCSVLDLLGARGCRVIAAYRLVGCMLWRKVVFKFGNAHANLSTKSAGSNAENTVVFLKVEMLMILNDLPTYWAPVVRRYSVILRHVTCQLWITFIEFVTQWTVKLW